MQTTIEVPEQAKRLVRMYEEQGYTLVQSEFPNHLLRMEMGFKSLTTAGGEPLHTVYITMGRSPLSLMNRDPSAGYINSTGNKIINRNWTPEFIKEGLKKLKKKT